MFWTKYAELCNKKGQSPNAVAAKCGVKSTGTVSGWKKGAIPRDGVLVAIAEYFGVTIDYLTEETSKSSSQLPVALSVIVETLNDSGVNELMNYGKYLSDKEEYRLSPGERRSFYPAPCPEEVPANISYIRHYLTPAAAGFASPIEGEDYELIPVTEGIPQRADFCIDIDGDSMAPYIADGSRVYVQRDVTLEPFDVGIFFVDGDVLCKQYCVDSIGNLYLLSANPKREDANRVISHNSGSTVLCFGKVILPRKLPQPSYT